MAGGERVVPDHGREAAGTLAAALIWAIGALAFFIGLGFAVHVMVDATVKSGAAAWRAAVGAVAATFLLAAIFALLIITTRGMTVLPRRVRRRRARRRATEVAPGPERPLGAG